MPSLQCYLAAAFPFDLAVCVSFAGLRVDG